MGIGVGRNLRYTVRAVCQEMAVEGLALMKRSGDPVRAIRRQNYMYIARS